VCIAKKSFDTFLNVFVVRSFSINVNLNWHPKKKYKNLIDLIDAKVHNSAVNLLAFILAIIGNLKLLINFKLYFCINSKLPFDRE